jgi:hypothetical protein
MPEPSDGAGRPLQVKERAWIACTSASRRKLATGYTRFVNEWNCQPQRTRGITMPATATAADHTHRTSTPDARALGTEGDLHPQARAPMPHRPGCGGWLRQRADRPEAQDKPGDLPPMMARDMAGERRAAWRGGGGFGEGVAPGDRADALRQAAQRSAPDFHGRAALPDSGYGL